MTQTYEFTGNRFEEIHGFITKLYKLADMGVKERNEAADRLIESYFMQFGEIPPASALERLGSFIMRDDYEDKSPDKVSKTEYPVLSESQQKRRSGRELPRIEIDTTQSVTGGARRSGIIIDSTGDEKKPTRMPIHPATVPNTTKLSLY